MRLANLCYIQGGMDGHFFEFGCWFLAPKKNLYWLLHHRKILCWFLIFLNSSAEFLIFKVVIAKFVDEYPLLYPIVTFDYHHYYDYVYREESEEESDDANMTSSNESSPVIEIAANIESNPVVFHKSSFVAVSYGGHLGLLELTKDWKCEDSTVH